MHLRTAWVVIGASLLAACGGNSSGSAKDYGTAPSPGSDNGNGSASNSGSDNPTNAGSDKGSSGTSSTKPAPPHKCGPTGPCPDRQYCSDQSASGGVCIETCTLPQGTTIGTSTCSAPEQCVLPPGSSMALCLFPCATAADCPAVDGLTALCEQVSSKGPSFCVWYPAAAPNPGGFKP